MLCLRPNLLQATRSPVIENLAATQDQFDSIDLSDNEVRKLECMAVLKRLNQLLLNNNRITRISEGLGRALPKLESLILTNNLLATLTELEPLAGVPTLTALSLVDNPVTKVKDYRAFVIAMLPRLKVLDYKRVKLAEREAAEAAFRTSRRGSGPLKGGAGVGASSSGEVLAIESGDGDGSLPTGSKQPPQSNRSRRSKRPSVRQRRSRRCNASSVHSRQATMTSSPRQRRQPMRQPMAPNVGPNRYPANVLEAGRRAGVARTDEQPLQ